MKIKLFTFSYPFGESEQFLHDEVAFLTNKGVRLTIVPFSANGEMRRLPESVQVDTSMALSLRRNSESKVYPLFLSSVSILKAIFTHSVTGVSAIRDLIGFAHHGRIIRNWAKLNVQKDEILYTYWFERITFGLVLFLKNSNDSNLLITRAHGYDVYEERRKHNFIPFRVETLKRIDQVFVVSQNGKNHLIKKYGFEDKIQRSNLGIRDHRTSIAEPDGLVRIVSCSSIIPLKRVELIMSVVKSYAYENQEQKVEWHHFGNGDISTVEEGIRDVPPNMKVQLHGAVPNEVLISYYKKNHVSLFINLSTTEGIPVSIMEAISFGIPVLATDVGGVGEIVNEKTGQLLNADFSIDNALEGITQILKNTSLRLTARKYFEENFAGEKNYESFYSTLKMLRA